MIKHLDGTFERIDYEKNSSVVLHLNREFENYTTHWHTAPEIIMPLENTYTVTINKVTYTLDPFNILFIPPGDLHEIVAPPTGTRIILQFDFSLISKLSGYAYMSSIIFNPHFITPYNAPPIHEPICNLLLQSKEEYATQDPLYEAYISSKIIEIYILLTRSALNFNILFPLTKPNKQLEYIEKFNAICNYINQNPTEDLSLNTISSMAGFSKFHFSRVFSQFTNMSYYDYINQSRIKKAEILLLNPNLSITDIALQSGFNSITTFNRVFKSVKECTPTEFKKLYYKNQ